MKTLTLAATAAIALALTGCTKPDRNYADDELSGNGSQYDQASNITPDTALVGAQNPASPEYFTQTVGDRVTFLVDQSTLTAQAMATLEGQATWLRTNTQYTAVIEGHADEQGTREYNLALGARRANAVREFLVSKGVDASRLQTVSYGKERPLAVCSTESCYSQNRRAVTVLGLGASG